ncbi:tetratricopeptide repeat protein [Seleniivibrio woodruffii]|uniref:Tetratricopeptide repeat protein n=1 Tax=Seleniivibrio woodruffii TaxID=1078050 RepID=A0A4R1K2I2_9BACT|nr:tetratricopeptide repeat protein [Seleniivibrio woodruffii]TCK58202.1 tetratricopeptide repeat protein [Seleniivibrio woodruffii]TVZ35667.1 tetratricopeptide repeat protein [Seleniivibrio woodruffii]
MLKRALIVCSCFSLMACAGQNAAVYYDAAAVSAKQPGIETALRTYDSTVKKSVHSQHYYGARGDIFFAYKDYGSAVNEYTKALRNADSAELHMKRAQAYMKLGFYPDAAYDFGMAAESGGELKYRAYAGRAKAYIELGKYAEALKDIDRAKSGADTSAELEKAMAEIFFKTADYAKAKEHVQRALASDPDKGELYFLRGRIFYKTKDANQALSDYERAVAMQPENTAAKYELARVLSTCPVSMYRDGQRAVRISQELFSTDPSADNAMILAASYAETGDFDKASDILKNAADKEKDLVKQDDMRVYLKAYQEKRTINTW